MSKPLIRVIGSLNIDFTTTTPRFPGPGETLTATSLNINPGGKGANQACACGRAAQISKDVQDVEVEIIGAVGANDPYYASMMKSMLNESGVSTAGVTELEGAKSGTASIIVDAGSGGENRILVVPGANHDGMGDFEEVMRRATRERRPDVSVMQGEIPQDTISKLLEESRSGKLGRVVFNPAPVFPGGIPREYLKGLGVLVVNQTEQIQVAEKLGQFKEQLNNESDDFVEWNMADFAAVLHDLGVGIVIITLANEGVFYSHGSTRRKDLVPGVKVQKVVDTTAAGDTFVGYFAVALARWCASGKGEEDFDIRSAISTANAAAAKCIQKSGAMQSIPWGYQ